jgi:spore germination protein YaaH
MLRFTLSLLAALVMLGCAEPEPKFEVFGYHTWWTGDAWTEYDLTAFDELLFFDLSVGPDGEITRRNGWPRSWTSMIEAADAAGTRVAPTLTIFDASVFNAIFTSNDAQEKLFNETLRAVRTAGASGVHIDFELFDDVAPEARKAFPRWVGRVKRALGDEAVVTVFTLAEDEHNRYDERALARAADYLIVQGYDFHWRDGPTAGPNAPLNGYSRWSWEGVIQRYDDLRVPRQKILMATPYYGYEWPTESGDIGSPTRGEGRILSYAPLDHRVPELGVAASELARKHGLRRDPASGSPFYAFSTEDGWVQGWFDDEVSLRAKFDFVRRNRLGGVAVFPLAYDGGRFTNLLHQAFPPDQRRTQRPGPEGSLSAEERRDRGG